MNALTLKIGLFGIGVDTCRGQLDGLKSRLEVYLAAIIKFIYFTAISLRLCLLCAFA
jgi:hypothetical protein